MNCKKILGFLFNIITASTIYSDSSLTVCLAVEADLVNIIESDNQAFYVVAYLHDQPTERGL